MTAAFTPGPWRATPNGYGVWFVHGGPDLISAGTGTAYRDLVCGGNNHNTLTEANARLIAAAPELYEALEALRDYGCPVCSGDCAGAWPPVTSCPMLHASRALAKVRGDVA